MVEAGGRRDALRGLGDGGVMADKQIIACPCGCHSFKLEMRDCVAVKDKKGKVLRPPLTDVKMLVCEHCGAETHIFLLFHPDSRLTWVTL